jgi:hypothetical protein
MTSACAPAVKATAIALARHKLRIIVISIVPSTMWSRTTPAVERGP